MRKRNGSDLLRSLLPRVMSIAAALCLLLSVAAAHLQAAQTTTQPTVKRKQTKRHKVRSKTPRKTSTPQPSAAASLPTGTWGGEHLNLNVTATGARLEFDCAQGTIDQAITLDAHNAFNVSGTYTQEHGGPIRIDEQPNGRPARYTGRVEGERLTLTITLADTQKSLGTYTLVHGQTARIFRCL
jgi:hypothetical protein